ncbi:MAG: hypothetical protein FJ194_19480 [Gammaproteobacteria bacterium]|nr:hypothetical protein [Gammaproteobacteria bacterium]
MRPLAHWIEAQGIATTLVGLIPQHVEAMRPPRALLVPFELGRPFGDPGDASLQHQVLDAALSLVARTDVPETRWLEVAGSTANVADIPWACPVSFPVPANNDAGGAAALLAEVDLLEPWHDRAVRARGNSVAGASGVSILDAVRFIAALRNEPWPAALPGLSVVDSFKLAAEDVKLWYLEAAAAQPRQRSSEIADWFWNATQASMLLRTLAGTLIDTPDKLLNTLVRLTLVPEARRA